MKRRHYTTGSDDFIKTARANPKLIDAVFEDIPGMIIEYQPGDFQLNEDSKGRREFWLACPGCNLVSPLAIRPTQSQKPSWELSGTEQAPTLEPSINHVGCWHGWLTNGQFTF